MWMLNLLGFIGKKHGTSEKKSNKKAAQTQKQTKKQPTSTSLSLHRRGGEKP